MSDEDEIASLIAQRDTALSALAEVLTAWRQVFAEFGTYEQQAALWKARVLVDGWKAVR